MSKEPKIRYVKLDPLKSRDPWKKLKEKPGVKVTSTARRNP